MTVLDALLWIGGECGINADVRIAADVSKLAQPGGRALRLRRHAVQRTLQDELRLGRAEQRLGWIPVETSSRTGRYDVSLHLGVARIVQYWFEQHLVQDLIVEQLAAYVARERVLVFDRAVLVVPPHHVLDDARRIHVLLHPCIASYGRNAVTDVGHVGARRWACGRVNFNQRPRVEQRLTLEQRVHQRMAHGSLHGRSWSNGGQRRGQDRWRRLCAKRLQSTDSHLSHCDHECDVNVRSRSKRRRRRWIDHARCRWQRRRWSRRILIDLPVEHVLRIGHPARVCHKGLAARVSVLPRWQLLPNRQQRSFVVALRHGETRWQTRVHIGEQLGFGRRWRRLGRFETVGQSRCLVICGNRVCFERRGRARVQTTASVALRIPRRG